MKLAIGSNVYDGATAVDVCVEMEAAAAAQGAPDSEMRQEFERGYNGDSCFACETAERLACFDARFARVSAVQSPPSHVWEFSDCEPLCKRIIERHHEETCQTFLDAIVDVGWGRWVADEAKV